jgi:hypothetical protein
LAEFHRNLTPSHECTSAIQQRIIAAGLKEGAAFRMPLAARILTGLPGLRWMFPTVIGWGVRPARVTVVGHELDRPGRVSPYSSVAGQDALAAPSQSPPPL